MTDSLYLALMVLTFFIPLVIYFATCMVGKVDEVQQDKTEVARKELRSNLAIHAVHPVLRQNCAVTRFVSQGQQREKIDLSFY
jgi:hypothetical protein